MEQKENQISTNKRRKMKTFKGYLKEASVMKPSGVGTHTYSTPVEDGVMSTANLENAEVLKKVNAFVGAVADGEYLNPQAAIYGLREKLMRIGLQFGDVETPGKNGTATAEVVQFGGRYGKDGTQAPDEVLNDDGISHRKEGGLKINFKYEAHEKGCYKVYAELV